MHHRRTFSQDYAAAASVNGNEGVWSDLGVLHIQGILLSNLASQENESKGLTRHEESREPRGRGAWRVSNRGRRVARANDDFETARQDTVEMLGMLHSEPDVMRKCTEAADSLM